MLRALRELCALLRGRPPGCSHSWEDEDVGRRYCPLCGEHQVLVYRKFTEVGQPAIAWETAFVDGARRRLTSREEVDARLSRLEHL